MLRKPLRMTFLVPTVLCCIIWKETFLLRTFSICGPHVSILVERGSTAEPWPAWLVWQGPPTDLLHDVEDKKEHEVDHKESQHRSGNVDGRGIFRNHKDCSRIRNERRYHNWKNLRKVAFQSIDERLNIRSMKHTHIAYKAMLHPNTSKSLMNRPCVVNTWLHSTWSTHMYLIQRSLFEDSLNTLLDWLCMKNKTNSCDIISI